MSRIARGIVGGRSIMGPQQWPEAAAMWLSRGLNGVHEVGGVSRGIYIQLVLLLFGSALIGCVLGI